MIRLIFVWLFMCSYVCVHSLQGQVVFWQKYLGGSQFDQGRKVLYRADGTMVIATEVYSNDHFGADNHSENSDVVIAKYSTQGEIFWQTTLGGSGFEGVEDIIETNDGGFVMIGASDSQDGDLEENGGGQDVWVAKIDETGNKLWSRSFGGTGDDKGTEIIQLSNGDYLIGGESSSINGKMRSRHHGGLDSWIGRLRKDGSLMWEKHYGGSGNEKVCGIHELQPEQFVIVNTTDSDDQQIETHLGAKDIWVFAIDSTLDILWQRTFGGEDNDDIHASLLEADGSLVMAGTTFSQEGQIPKNQGGGDMWVFKVNPLGIILWTHTFGGPRSDGANALSPTHDGGYVVSGLTKSRTGEGDIIVNQGYYDGLLVKIDSLGQHVWSRTLGNSGKDILADVVELPDGGFLTIGYSIQGASGMPLPGHHGVGDIWLCNFGDPDRPGTRPFVTPPIMIGKVLDKDTGRPLEATITLTDNATLDSLSVASTNPSDGSFLLLMPAYGMVSINALAKGYMFYGQDIRMDTVVDETSIKKEIKLEAIRIGSSLILKNIYFNTGSWKLLKPSHPELERVVAFLKLNPRVMIQVSGHTDNTGDASQKVQLSLNRANQVKKYLIYRGIAENRLRVKGYGKYRPIASNRSAEGRRKNRRVEFKVLNL